MYLLALLKIKSIFVSATNHINEPKLRSMILDHAFINVILHFLECVLETKQYNFLDCIHKKLKQKVL